MKRKILSMFQRDFVSVAQTIIENLMVEWGDKHFV